MRLRYVSLFILPLALGLLTIGLVRLSAQSISPGENDDFVPVTDAMIHTPAPGDWLIWRRTLNSWGFSPLDEMTRGNVEELRLVWTRALGPGRQQGTPLAYGGVLYMPNPRDVIQAIDAVTGDLLWEHRRDNPDDVYRQTGGALSENNRNLAIYDRLIIDTSVAPERSLGSRPSVREIAGGHGSRARPHGRRLDQPAVALRRDATGRHGDSRQDRPRLYSRPRDGRVPVGYVDGRAKRHQQTLWRDRRRHRELRGRV